jgi:hypothetical protein
MIQAANSVDVNGDGIMNTYEGINLVKIISADPTLASLIGPYLWKMETQAEIRNGNLENGHLDTNISELTSFINSPAFSDIYMIASHIPMERQADTPAADTPAADTPAADTPAADTPAADTPAADTPANNLSQEQINEI